MSVSRTKLQSLADKYEVKTFVTADPSQFLYWYDNSKSTTADIECAAFIAAMLSFGSRTQFIPKIRNILELADSTSGSIKAWLLAGAPGFSDDTKTPGMASESKKFYRFYSYEDMSVLFSEMADLLRASGSLGKYFREKYEEATSQSAVVPHLSDIISSAFPKAKIVPKGRNSANKRIHMFLRWMVRTASPVDLGLWTWYSPVDLLIPLDVHVMQEGVNLGLLPSNARATRKTAEKLTAELAKVFPGDPARADFALFGLGVDSDSE